jgi:hypothetical protein
MNKENKKPEASQEKQGDRFIPSKRLKTFFNLIEAEEEV